MLPRVFLSVAFVAPFLLLGSITSTEEPLPCLPEEIVIIDREESCPSAEEAPVEPPIEEPASKPLPEITIPGTLPALPGVDTTLPGGGDGSGDENGGGDAAPGEGPSESSGGSNNSGEVSPDLLLQQPRPGEPYTDWVPSYDFTWPGAMMLSGEAIRAFDIPPFLLPIYQACGTEYNVPWQILASINRIETSFGRNLNVSYAGARGWMQFMPETWKAYGVDANRDGKRDPYNPVDAICSAASYLEASGIEEDMRSAIFAYNRADWYVDDVLEGAQKYYSMPLDLVAAISALASAENPPADLEGSAPRRKHSVPGMIFPRARYARAVADGKVLESGISRKFGRFVVLGDSSGNRYLYGGLRGKLPVPHKPSAKKEVSRQKPATQAKARSSRTKKESAPAPRIRRGIVHAGDQIARAGKLFFGLRPAGKTSPWVQPGAFVRGWRALEKSAWGGARPPQNPSTAQILLLPRPRLQELVLGDRNLEISECDRNYIRQGMIDRRVLSLLSYLSAQGFRLGISSMLCGREASITVSGNASYHSFGQAIDIATINGESVLGNQQPGSLSEAVVRRIMEMQGAMRPQELISLFDFGPPSWSDPVDHADHIHVGYGDGSEGDMAVSQTIGAGQWDDITDRLGEIDIPNLDASGKRMLRGRVSYFNGPSDSTASGISVRTPGVALNLRPGTDEGWNNAVTQKWMRWARAGRPMMVLVRTQGKRAVLPVIDVGPAGWTNRAIDITEAGLGKLGIAPSRFRTDDIGTAVFLGRAQ